MNHGTFSGIISDAHDIVPDMESEATTLKSHTGGETVEELRKTEIGVIGDVPWGTHICQFYRTREDLIDILVPYFKAGLENNEFCIWVTSEPLRVGEARAALKKAVKNLDDYIKKGQIEILDYNEWYTRSGKFNADEVLKGWVEKEKLALKKGFSGLRLTGNTFWLESKDWKDFSDYEATVDSIIGKYRMIAICSYSMDICGAPEVIDVVNNHRFALIRREDKWIAIQSAERAKAKEALRESEQKLRLMFDSVTDGITVTDLAAVITDVNERVVEMHGCHAKSELLGKSGFEFIAAREHEKAMTDLLETLKEGIGGRGEYALLKADGSEFLGELSASVLKDASGQAVGFIAVTRDITERKRAEEEIWQNYQNQAALDVLLRVSLAAGSLQALLQDSLKRLVSLPWLGLEPKGSIFLVEDDPEVLTMKAQRGLTTPLLDACTRVPFGYCLCGRAASSGKVQFANCVDERHQTGCQGLSHHGHYCVPILSAGKVMGVINLYLKEGHRRDEREVDFLKAAAKVLAGAIERKRAEEEVLGRNRELTALHRALISISQTLDLKEVLRQIISQAGIAVDSAYTSIVLVNHDGSPGMSAEDFVVIPPLSVRVRPQGVDQEHCQQRPNYSHRRCRGL
jgi:PAS domain S-box-containing protein